MFRINWAPVLLHPPCRKAPRGANSPDHLLPIPPRGLEEASSNRHRLGIPAEPDRRKNVRPNASSRVKRKIAAKEGTSLEADEDGGGLK